MIRSGYKKEVIDISFSNKNKAKSKKYYNFVKISFCKKSSCFYNMVYVHYSKFNKTQQELNNV